MTFLQPKHHKSLINFLLGVLSLAVFASILWIIVAYNQTVNLNHDIMTMKSQLDTIGAQNTALTNQMVAMLGSDELSKLSSSGQLVPENKPQYFSVGNQWSIASQ